MSMYRQNANPAVQQRDAVSAPAEANGRMRLVDRLFASYWGLALISALVAVGIGASAIHSGHMASMAQNPPEAEAVAVEANAEAAPAMAVEAAPVAAVETGDQLPIE